MAWDLSGLDKYLSRVTALQNADLKKEISTELEKQATPVLNQYYPHDTVYTVPTNNGFHLIGTGNGLWFREFGTGIVGKGTYPDSSKLPKSTLTFVGKFGQMWMTNGWQYEYHPITQKLHYWYTPTGGKNYGQVAQAGFYKTSVWIKHNGGRVAEESIRRVIE